MKILNYSTTNLILVMFALATILLTFKGMVDPKDFMTVVMMVLGYKFAKNKTVDNNSSNLG